MAKISCGGNGPSLGTGWTQLKLCGPASLRPAGPHLKLPAPMGISQPQNLRAPVVEEQRPFGVRVSLPPGDPFRKILGPEWHRIHWYPSPEERDAALAEMSRRHQYSRGGDRPSIFYDKIENLAESRGI